MTAKEFVAGLVRLFGASRTVVPKVRRHCWHTLSAVSVTITGGHKDDVQCCHCGVPTRRTWRVHYRPDPGHGAHASKPIAEDGGTPLDREVCPGPFG